MPDSELKKHSVTRDDIVPASQGGVFHFMLNPQMTNGMNECPPWWTPARDYYLRSLINREAAWAGAVAIAATKVTSQGWEIAGNQPRVRDAVHELVMNWMIEYGSRDIFDFLNTDNGCFTEIVRASSGAGARVLGLVSLDSLRCTRTGDDEQPVLYRDTLGREHILQAHQVLMLSDLPDPSATMHGIGHCAAGRAVNQVLKLESIERYIYEKVSGKRPLAIHIVNGVSEPQMRTAMQSTYEDSIEKKQIVYMGAAVIPTLSDIEPNLLTIPLAELPDGFDRKEEFDIAMLIYANSIGLDPQDLQPLTGQSLGSGAQSVVLHEKSQGRGLTYYRQQKTHQFNTYVLPGTTTFAFSEDDSRDRKQHAETADIETKTVIAQITSGIITSAQGAQILADAEIIPREFVPVDTTPGGVITDAEKPEMVLDAENAQAQNEQAQANVNSLQGNVNAPEATTSKQSLRAQFADALRRFNEAMR